MQLAEHVTIQKTSLEPQKIRNVRKINTQSLEFASSALRKNTLEKYQIVEKSGDVTDRRTNKGSWMAEFYNDIDHDQTKKCSFAFASCFRVSFLLLKIGAKIFC